MKKIASLLAASDAVKTKLISGDLLAEDSIQALMRRAPSHRSANDLSRIVKYLLKLSFFQKLKQEADEETVRECGKCIYARSCAVGEVTGI